MALSNCNRKLAELGPLGENYSTDCRCQVVVSNERLCRARSLLPDDSYARCRSSTATTAAMSRA